MRISKVYTKTGDGGRTRLAGGQEIAKDAIRVEAYGTVDELNAIIGLVRVFNQEQTGNGEASIQLEEYMKWIQNKLFDIGGLLATAPGQDTAYGSRSLASDRMPAKANRAPDRTCRSYCSVRYTGIDS